MKTILLAGRASSRFADEAAQIPEPLIEIGGRSMLAHIMDIYSHFGHEEFIVAAGFKSLLIKQYFASYNLIANDITVSTGTGEMTLKPSSPGGWSVSVVDTGRDVESSGCLAKLKDWIDGETFMVAYGNCVGNVDIDALLAFHRNHGKLATVTAVRPHTQSGFVEMEGDRVKNLSDAVPSFGTWINGGFFVFEPAVLDYMIDDAQSLDQGPLPQIAQDGELMAFRHRGFWHPIESQRDHLALDRLASADQPPWLQFDSSPQTETVVKAEWRRSHNGAV